MGSSWSAVVFQIAGQFGLDGPDAREAGGEFLGQGAGESVVGDADGLWMSRKAY